MNSEEKCGFIISKVRNQRVVVFEGGLKPQEEALLIEKTMNNIDHETFKGVEILSPAPVIEKGFFGKKDTKMTVIVPANYYEKLSVVLV